jgi:glycosyltransferase involved in cell wall biosynthesis
MNIAYFSPLPPARSGIADYSRDLLPHLAQQATVTLFADEPVEEELAAWFEIRPFANYPAQRWQFDATIYQMGNSDQHEAIYQMFLRYPDVLVLHDYFLHHFMAHRYAGEQFPGYVRERGYARGMRGVQAARQIPAGRPYPLYDLPLNDRLLDLSLGVIVHSAYVRQLVVEQRPLLPVAVIPEMIAQHPGQSRRAELDWPDDAIIFASVGQITPAKQIDLALRAFAKVRQTVPQVRYLLVGEAETAVNLSQLIAELELAGAVRYLGRVDNFQAFIDWVHTADVVVNLRHPTIGETSAAALRAMAAGKPLIVFDHGWYSELPEDACAQVPPLDEAALVESMLMLAQSAAKRGEMGQAAVGYITHTCSPAQAAQAYLTFVRQLRQQLTQKYA